jgi:glycosyltransferase involved in cell wall biosynthesis
MLVAIGISAILSPECKWEVSLVEVLNDKQDFRTLSFILVTHSYVYGPVEVFRDFLLDAGTQKLAYIAHPFQFAPDVRSYMSIYENGEIVREFRSPYIRGPELILYLRDSVFTFLFVITGRRRYSIYVGADPLNALLGLILKSLGIVRHVIFYTIDYVPQRFANRLLNNAYHVVDKMCVEHCDVTWNLSDAMTTARMKEGVRGGSQLEVPLGTYQYLDAPDTIKTYDRNSIMFIGHLRKGHGLELLLPAFSKVLEKVPQAKLIILGGGPLEQSLQEEVNSRKLENSVELRGYIKDREQTRKIISTGAFGLAPYEPSAESFTWYADPGKPKDYISCGLPVIITSVPLFSKEIEKHKAGLVVPYDEKSLTDAMILLLTDKPLLDAMRLHASELSKKYSWSQVFHRALAETLDRLASTHVGKRPHVLKTREQIGTR